MTCNHNNISLKITDVCTKIGAAAKLAAQQETRQGATYELLIYLQFS